jgi:HAD superfamily hydrolase (TIGR01549 family)
VAAIRAIFLDVGWTLAYPRTSMWQIFADLCADAGVTTTPAACEQLVRSLSRATSDHAEEQFRGGARYADSDAAFAGMFAQMGRMIFAQMGVPAGHDDLMQRFLLRFWNAANWTAFPEVLEVLQVLRARGVRLGVLSNAPSNLPSFLEQLGIAPLLDFSVVSAVEGVKKPDRRIFEIALSHAGVAPAEALHVGDMYLEDVLGGRAVGINTLLIERGARALFPSYRESEGRGLAPDTVIGDLREVLTHCPGLKSEIRNSKSDTSSNFD